ncbi:hypothetical protein OHQ89_31955 [Streptomyces canus]|uniref:hypothetical protein n=1 Tax=Streptomyces canus TaxID=58343 RepID=UPI002E285532|nr:hypothetical protein [Streptomyces canus]
MSRSLAAVAHYNPDHPPTWAGTFGLLAMFFGCAIALIGVYAAFSTWRELDRSRRRAQLLPLTLLATFFLTVGLAVTASGVWLF